MPPSVIADTWTAIELRKAEALARLEGWGQDKRRTAAVLAEMHNVSRLEAWSRSADANTPKPKLLSEEDFLRKNVKAKPVVSARPAGPVTATQQSHTKLKSIMNSLCGYR